MSFVVSALSRGCRLLPAAVITALIVFAGVQAALARPVGLRPSRPVAAHRAAAKRPSRRTPKQRNAPSHQTGAGKRQPTQPRGTAVPQPVSPTAAPKTASAGVTPATAGGAATSPANGGIEAPLAGGSVGAAPTGDTEPPLFSSTSVWNLPLSGAAAIDPNSAAMVSDLASQAASEYQQGVGPDIGTTGTTSFYEVGPAQPTVTVQLSSPTAWWRVALQSAFEAVPIPPNAKPGGSGDAEMTIWQPSTDKLWEFFHMAKETDGWHADWGGAIQHVSQSPGYFTTSSWPGALSVWGATATSLPTAAGVISLKEMQQAYIPHALALDVPYARARVFTRPAQRGDGTGTDANAIPEGAILRLPPTLDLSALHLPPLTMAIAQAAQTYGMIVRDQTHYAIGLFAQNPVSFGTNPYYTSSGTPTSTGPFKGQYPDSLMSKFPWSYLEVLKLTLQSSS